MKLAVVEFYSAPPRGQCREHGLLALSTCAAHKAGIRGVGMRIVIRWQGFDGARKYVRPDYFCNACAHKHERQVINHVLSIGKSLYTRCGVFGARLRLFDGRGTRADFANARKMRDAAVRKLRALGYYVEVEDERGGRELLKPTGKWKPVETCTHPVDRSRYA